MKKIVALLAGLFFYASASAQDATKTFLDDPFNSPQLPFYIMIAFVFIVMILVIAILILSLSVINLLTREMERKHAEALGNAYVPSPSWFEKLVEQLNDSVPVANEGEIELDHSYDGIKELDNHLPPWWKGLFYATIVFAVVYIFMYHFSNSFPLAQQEYENEVANAALAQQKYLASQPQATIDESTLVYTKDAAIIEKGKAVFTSMNCKQCHGEGGGGNSIGPNLTDEYWLHGGGIKNVFNTINKGVVEKGMPAWGKSMSPTDVRDVAFYVLSLQGTKPANAKAPQGELYKPEIKTEKADSTKTVALKK